MKRSPSHSVWWRRLVQEREAPLRARIPAFDEPELERPAPPEPIPAPIVRPPSPWWAGGKLESLGRVREEHALSRGSLREWYVARGAVKPEAT